MPISLKPNDVERSVLDALRACLADVPFIQLPEMSPQPGAGGPDLLLRTSLPEGGEQHLVVQVKKSGQPRMARAAVNDLRRFLSDHPNAYGVFAAPYISERSASLCREEGIGSLDLAGNCHLSFGRIFISKTGNENPFSEKRELRTLYSPKASRVLRVLIETPRRAWKVKGLANAAHVSLGQVSNVKKLLEDREWVRADPEGMRLTDPEALLGEWSENQRYRRDRFYSCYSIHPGPETERRIARACARHGIRYALTEYAAAARWAPMVRSPRTTAYVHGDVRLILRELELKEVHSGSNLRLIEPGDDGVFYAAESMDDLVVASPIQVYLDLKRTRGRGDDAAEAILEETIKPRW